MRPRSSRCPHPPPPPHPPAPLGRTWLRRQRSRYGVTIVTAQRRIHLLDADPELGRLLQGQRLIDARRDLLCRLHTLERGPWDAERLRSAGPEHVGLLLLEGVLAREIALEDNVSAELLGPGDIVRPWQMQPPSQLMRAEVRWTVVEQARFAILD